MKEYQRFYSRNILVKCLWIIQRFVLKCNFSSTVTVALLASCLIYSYAFMEYINRFAVDRMVTLFFTMLPSVKFAEENVLVSLFSVKKMLE